MKLATRQIAIYYLFLSGLVLSTFVFISKKFPFIVEHFYSQMLYADFAESVRAIFDDFWLPVGDILFLLFFGYLFYICYYWILRIIRGQRNRVINLNTLFFIFSIGLFFYSIFNCAWGLNYNRLGVNYQLELEQENDYDLFTEDELDTLAFWVVREINVSYARSKKLKNFKTLNELKNVAYFGFKNLALKHSLFEFKNPTLKISFFQNIIPYFNIIGYFNPFTNEAIISNKNIGVMIPFAANYELAHSMGYAKYEDATVVAFLAAKYSTDDYMYYSALINLFYLIADEMKKINPYLEKEYRLRLLAPVQKDLWKIRKFHTNAKGFLRTFFSLSVLSLSQKQLENKFNQRYDCLRFIFLYLKKYTNSFEYLNKPEVYF